MTVALIAGRDEGEVAALRAVATDLFGPSTATFTIEIGESSIDLDLAWGAGNLAVATPEGDLQEQPLPSVGDAAVAVVEAARRFDADVVVVAPDDRSVLTRMLAGSATRDLVDWAPLPILVVRIAER